MPCYEELHEWASWMNEERDFVTFWLTAKLCACAQCVMLAIAFTRSFKGYNCVTLVLTSGQPFFRGGQRCPLKKTTTKKTSVARSSTEMNSSGQVIRNAIKPVWLLPLQLASTALEDDGLLLPWKIMSIKWMAVSSGYSCHIRLPIYPAVHGNVDFFRSAYVDLSLGSFTLTFSQNPRMLKGKSQWRWNFRRYQGLFVCDPARRRNA